jgi:hypothetical protein
MLKKLFYRLIYSKDYLTRIKPFINHSAANEELGQSIRPPSKNNFKFEEEMENRRDPKNRLL